MMPATFSTADLQRAYQLRECGRPAEAMQAALPLAEAAPDDVDVWLLLGGAALDLGSYDEAARAYWRVLDLRPDDRDGLIGLGLVRQGQGRAVEARSLWDRTARVHDRDPVPPTLLGVNLMRAGAMDRAETWFREALTRSPGHADALAGLGSILERTGRAAEGAALLEPAASGAQVHGAVASIRARCLLGDGQADAALATVERALAIQPSRSRQIQLEHVRGDVLDQLQRSDEAFAAFARANSLRTAPFDGARHLSAVRILLQIFTGDRLASLPRGCDRRRRSVLVVGVPRSGTSLIERLLSRHPRVAAAGELDTWRLQVVDLARRWQLAPGDIWYRHLDRLTVPLLDELGATYNGVLDEFAGADTDLVIDKMPHNVFQLPLAALALPGTIVVRAVRDPEDTGWSCFRQNFTDGLAWSTRLDSIGLYIRAEREAMAHWRRVLDVPIITVRYEDLTADPRAALEPVLAAGDLAWDDRLLESVGDEPYMATASYREIRRPLYRTSVGRAQSYAANLEPLRRVLAALGPLPQ